MEQTETLVFENKNLRIIGTIDNPLFTLKDVCEILKIKNITDCSNTIPKEHKDIKKVESASGYYSMIVINQKALLKLCMKSKNISAQQFYDFVSKKIESFKKDDEIKQDIQIETFNLEIKEYKIKLDGGDTFMIPINKDGFLNATELCKAADKRFNNYYRSESTQEYLKVLEDELKICNSELIIMNNENNKSDTWVHRKVAYHLAQWISPKFAVQVSNILDEYFLCGKVEEKSVKEMDQIYQDKIKSLQKIIEEKSDKVDELKSELKDETNLVMRLKKSVMGHAKKFHFYHSFRELPSVYILRDPNRLNQSEFKIGYTDNINKRLEADRCMIPDIKIEFLLYCSNAPLFENVIKHAFREKLVNLNHEWLVEPLEKLVKFYRELNRLGNFNGTEEEECYKYNLNGQEEIIEEEKESKEEEEYQVDLKKELLSDRLKNILPGWLLKSDYIKINEKAPEGKRYCDGWCKTYQNMNEFRGTYSGGLLPICKHCENMEDMARLKIEKGETTIEQIKKDPLILKCGSSDKICRQCMKPKDKEKDFEPNNRKCRECKRQNSQIRIVKIDYKERIKILLEIKNKTELEYKMKEITKDEYIMIMSELSLGRLATDRKEDMFAKTYSYFCKLI